jgi:glycosyltransferase involved in cell wall biosynthesis
MINKRRIGKKIMSKTVIIFRNFANEVNLRTYNLQEIGLGKAFLKMGYNCEIVYYSKEFNKDETIYTNNGCSLIIKWRRATKILNNGVYFSELIHQKLNNYEYIITTEYNQIMSFLLSFIVKKNKLILYHGPYKDQSKKIVHNLYDFFITPFMTRRIAKTFTKTERAKLYLANKGFNNISVVGVGLDIEKLEGFSEYPQIEMDSKEAFQLLYVGKLEKRRNIDFIIQVLHQLTLKGCKVHLSIVGNGKKKDKDEYFKLINSLDLNKNISYFEQLDQQQLKKLYTQSDLFIFPSAYEIFGMVLLESMYYRLPIISTKNAGAEMLINNNNGVLMDSLDVKLWTNQIEKLIYNSDLLIEMGNNGRLLIESKYNWDFILSRMLNN